MAESKPAATEAQPPTQLTAVSLFAGVGGIDLALERAGVKVTAAVEIDTAARGVLADHFPETTLFNDVTKVTPDELLATGFDPVRGILAGGFPCQDLSVAGRRKGLGGARSGLFWHIMRLADALRPQWLLLENVPGLLSSNDGRDMGTVLAALGESGYGYAYRVLDAEFFGVPQRRDRVFIVGCLGDARRPVEVLLEPESSGRDHPTRKEARARVAATLTAGTSRAGVSAPGRRQEDDVNLVVGGWRVGADEAAAGQLVCITGDRTHALTSEGADASEDGTGRGSPIVPTTEGVRRFTPVERERLQGFPDDWTATSNGKRQADSARDRQMGNAVAVPCVEWIARRIVEVA